MKSAAKTKEAPKSAAPKRMAKGFDGGKSGRRLRAIPTNNAAINTQIRTYGKQLLARSRYLALNNPYAMAARDEFVSAMVGCGIKPSPLIKESAQKAEVVELWRDWTDEADADGLTDFYGLQGIIAGEMFEAGECFVRMRSRFASDGLTVPLQLQLLPAEMLQTDYNETLANGGRIECGIEFSPIGERVAYHFLRVHPGEMTAAVSVSKSERTRVPAAEVLHLFKPVRAGQIRGIPHTVAGIVTLAMLDLYDDAELERKRIAALFGAFVETNGNEDETHPFAGSEAVADNDLQETTTSDWSLEPGAVIDLRPGQKVTFAEPADVGGNYEVFQYRMLLRAAAGFGGTYAGMTGDLRGTSYSSIRAGLVQFRRKVEAQQHQVMVFQFCRPVWNAWMKAAVLNGALSLVRAAEFAAKPREYARVKWIPPKWEWVDPLKDRQAEKLAVDSGFKSRSDVIEAEGYDPEETDTRIAADQDRAESLGIKFAVVSSGLIFAPTAEEQADPNAQPGTIPPGGGDNVDTSLPQRRKQRDRARKETLVESANPRRVHSREFDFG